MKAVLVAVNAKYVHTNLAVRSIAARLRTQCPDWTLAVTETAKGNPCRGILTQLVDHRADVYLFSCYIWNIDLMRRLAWDLKAALPEAVLVAAGPQVSYHCEEFLRVNPAFGFVLSGEGEDTTPQFLEALEQNTGYGGCPGLAWRDGPNISMNPPGQPVDLDTLSFAYTDLDTLEGRILYYESMRGCPFHCAYCLSAGEQLRLRSLPLVFADLSRFLEAEVRQVKLVDRTFNASKAHAMAIWEYLIGHDNGRTNFHFELSGELVDEDMLALLAQARSGLFQFEIGVQTVNPDTLEAIGRPSDFETLAAKIGHLREVGGIHLHLDLIAGLPYEGMDSFADSFNKVFLMEPDQLQLGFLKVLPGTVMERRAAEWGIVYSAYAPFEVLRTPWLSFQELALLHGIDDMVDTYHNSGRFSRIMSYIESHFSSPFACYRALWALYQEGGYDAPPLSKTGYYELLKPFMEAHGIPIDEKAKWLCKYDIVAAEKPRKAVSWVDVDLSDAYRAEILAILSKSRLVEQYLPSYRELEPKQIRRTAHVEIIPFHPLTMEQEQVAILVDYALGHVNILLLSDIL